MSQSERDGSTPATAILEDQNVWRTRHCPGWTLGLQKLMVIDGTYVDALTLFSPSGDEVRVVYFVLTHFGRVEGPV